MTKLSTMVREAKQLQPQLFEEVLVWSSVYRQWRLARHDGKGIYTVEANGKRKAVPEVRYWMPLPKLPK